MIHFIFEYVFQKKLQDLFKDMNFEIMEGATYSPARTSSLAFFDCYLAYKIKGCLKRGPCPPPPH